MKYDYLIVGAGFSGSVCAERLASVGKRVLVIDKRSHVGGNAYDCVDAHGVLIHPYGPHIFHTNSKRIFEYLSRFTNWRFYEHRVLANIDDHLYPMPINRTTINRLYGLSLDEEGVAQFYEKVRVDCPQVKTSEDVVLNGVGHDLCDKFFRGYTRKQWGCDLSELSAGVAARVPARINNDDRYFTDVFQFMPADGYASLFKNLLGHPNIEVRINADWEQIKSSISYGHVIYTGPIDAFFGYCYGKLPYRSLRFDHEHIADRRGFQETATINYPNEYEFTRITEFKKLTGQQHSGTSIVREFPQAEGDPYYPIPRAENESLFKKYELLAKGTNGVTFVGRLAQYRYYNMDQVVGAALAATKDICGDIA